MYDIGDKPQSKQLYNILPKITSVFAVNYILTQFAFLLFSYLRVEEFQTDKHYYS